MNADLIDAAVRAKPAAACVYAELVSSQAEDTRITQRG